MSDDEYDESEEEEEKSMPPEVAAELDTWRAVIAEKSKTWRTMNDVGIEMAKNCPNLFRLKMHKSPEEFLAKMDAKSKANKRCGTCGRCAICERCGYVDDSKGPGPALQHWIDRTAGLLPPSPKFKLPPLTKEDKDRMKEHYEHEIKILADLRAAGMPKEVCGVDTFGSEVALVCHSSHKKKVVEFLDKIGNLIDGKPARASVMTYL